MSRSIHTAPLRFQSTQQLNMKRHCRYPSPSCNLSCSLIGNRHVICLVRGKGLFSLPIFLFPLHAIEQGEKNANLLFPSSALKPKRTMMSLSSKQRLSLFLPQKSEENLKLHYMFNHPSQPILGINSHSF